MRFDELAEPDDTEVWIDQQGLEGTFRVPFSERCVECGERIEAADWDAFVRRYTEHQVAVHGKPRSTRE